MELLFNVLLVVFILSIFWIIYLYFKKCTKITKCSFGYHDLEILDIKSHDEIKKNVNDKYKVTHYSKEQDQDKEILEHKMICLKCGKVYDEIQFMFEIYENKFLESVRRKALAIKLIKEQEK